MAAFRAASASSRKATSFRARADASAGRAEVKKGLFCRGTRVKLSKTGPQDTDRQTNDNLFCHSRAPFKPSSRRHRRGPSFFPSFPLYNSPRWRYGAGALLARTSDAFSSTIRTDVSLTTKCVETVVRLSRRVPSFIGSTCRVKVCWRATVASALDRGNVICPAHRSSKTLLGVFYVPASFPSASWPTRSRVPRPRVAEASSASVARTGSMALPALVPSRMRAVDAPRLQRRQPDRGNGQPSAGHAQAALNAVRASVSCGEIAARAHAL